MSRPNERADWGEPRTKTVTWHNPQVAARGGRTIAGVDHLRAMRDGLLPPPPISAVLGIDMGHVEIGDVTFVCTPDESVYNPIGVVHGGLVCTLLDSALGCAVQSTLPAGVGYTSLEIKISYLRPVHAGVELVAHGWVRKAGRRVAFAEGDVRDRDGAILATASGSCLVIGSAG